MEKHNHHTEEVFMQRALELASLGRGHVSPNPMVGCVVVFENKIIGEGWHRQYGGPHAEVNAIDNVADKSLLKESTAYVNLEPCAHIGKTPPCVDLLISHRIKRVVVASLDSNPLVAGEGIKKLRTEGIETITGILEKQGRELNRRFFTFMEHERPYIILKWAETADGFMARENYDSKWISNEFSRKLVHKWRTEEDAVLVGQRTVAYDDPQLNVRDWSGRNPVRIVIDRFLKSSEKLHVFDRKQRTICYNVLKHEEFPNLLLMRLDDENFLNNLVHDLYKQKIQSVIVEGGATTLSFFLDSGLWDEARIFTSSRVFHKGIAAPKISSTLVHRQSIEGDWLSVYHPHS